MTTKPNDGGPAFPTTQENGANCGEPGMTNITIPLEVANAASEALGNFVSDHGWSDSDMQAMDNLDSYIARHKAIRAEMSAVADQYAHKLALDLECVLADYSGTWYDAAISTLGAYRDAMNAIHERESPTFMGEPIVSSGELTKPAQHDAPEVAALKAERDAVMKDAERYRWLRNHGDSGCTGKDGYGGQELLIDERLDAAIDAAIAKAEGRTE